MNQKIKMNIKKGDMVTAITGKDKGKSGKVVLVLREQNRVVVEGINMYKKHKKPTKQGEKGQIITLPRSIHRSNVKKNQ